GLPRRESRHDAGRAGGWREPMRAQPLWLVVCLCACSDERVPAAGDTGSTGTSGETTAMPASSSGGSEADSSSTGLPDEGTTTEETTCGNGRMEPGELCLDDPLHVAVGLAPADVAIADFDGDGVLDIVTANVGSNDHTLLLGDGTGQFEVATTLLAG